MISKNDCMLLLADIEKKGISTTTYIEKLYEEDNIPLEVIQFINNQIQFDVRAFYEKLRKSYNDKKSKLYINIVKETTNPKLVLTTLSSLLTQLLLFTDNTKNREMFLRHSRANEITKVLNNYFNTYDLTSCIKLLRLFKADIKAFEEINKEVTK